MITHHPRSITGPMMNGARFVLSEPGTGLVLSQRGPDGGSVCSARHPGSKRIFDRHLERGIPGVMLRIWPSCSAMQALPICAAVASDGPLPEPVQCCLRDLAPAVVDRQRVAAIRELDEVGDGR